MGHNNFPEQTKDVIIYYQLKTDRFENGNNANDTGDWSPEDNHISNNGIVSYRLQHGFDPTDKRFFQGGDFQGIQKRINYIKNLYATHIWISPIFKNQPVQSGGTPGSEQAGYHGYWQTDLTRLNPYFGEEKDLLNLSKAAKEQNLSLVIDLVFNHTADIIQYKELDLFWKTIKEKNLYETLNHLKEVEFTAFLDAIGLPHHYSYSKKFGIGLKYNPEANYSPYIPDHYKYVKKPDILNKLSSYNNRGNTNFSKGDNGTYGDFYGLDDIDTSNKDVLDSILDCINEAIVKYDFAQARLDAIAHIPREDVEYIMDKLLIPSFGEVFDSDQKTLSSYPQPVLDFAFQQVAQALLLNGTNNKIHTRYIENKSFFPFHIRNITPNFISSHDDGRVGRSILSQISETQHLQALNLIYLYLITARGNPVIYYGDEQGFTGDGGDQDARETMFPSRVSSYNDNKHIGTSLTPAASNFDNSHPTYKHIQTLNKLIKKNPEFSNGAELVRCEHDDILVDSRFYSSQASKEFIRAINFSKKVVTKKIRFQTFSKNKKFDILFSTLQSKPYKSIVSDSNGLITLDLPNLSSVILKSQETISSALKRTQICFNKENSFIFSNSHLQVNCHNFVPGIMRLDYRVNPNSPWKIINFNDSPTQTNDHKRTYFTFYIPELEVRNGETVYFRATYKNAAGNEYISTTQEYTYYNQDLTFTINYQNGNDRNSVFAYTDTGEFLFPTTLKNNSLAMTWKREWNNLYLIYENGYQFDQPIHLNRSQIFKHFKQSKANEKIVYINNEGELRQSKYYITRSLPRQLDLIGGFKKDIYFRGSPNQWSTTNKFNKISSGIYEATVKIPSGKNEFKFADNGWNADMNYGLPIGKNGLSVGKNPSNIKMTFKKLSPNSLYNIKLLRTRKGNVFCRLAPMN